jgi:hypothetical protein
MDSGRGMDSKAWHGHHGMAWTAWTALFWKFAMFLHHLIKNQVSINYGNHTNLPTMTKSPSCDEFSYRHTQLKFVFKIQVLKQFS